jgi:hypothetical protein
VTLVESVIEVGRTLSLATIASAWARPVWSAALNPLLDDAVELDVAEAEVLAAELVAELLAAELLELLEPLELQAASVNAAATASTAAARRSGRARRLRACPTRVIGPPEASRDIMIMDFDSYHNHDFLTVKELAR